MNKLKEIFNKYSLDKVYNKYDNLYSNLFDKKRFHIKSLLEIGIGTTDPNMKSTMYHYKTNDSEFYQHGNSLRAWRDYFKNANIYGIDIDPNTMFVEDKIKTFCSSSMDENEMNKILSNIGKHDVIIDDGLHTMEANIKTLEILFPYLNDGGLYIIEDINQHDDYYIDNLLIDERFVNITKGHTYNIYDGFNENFTRIIVINKNISKESKIPIIMPTYNRADYLKVCLDNLSKCRSLDKFFIITSEEPNEEVSNILDNVNFIDIVRNKNEQKLGCNANLDKCINYGLNYEKFIILEDDVVSSKDFLEYFLWCFETTKYIDDVSLIIAYNQNNDLTTFENIQYTNQFMAWGWGCYSSKFLELKSLGFNIDYNKNYNHETSLPEAWDAQLCQFILENNITILKPQLSRVQNIGSIGTWTKDAEWHKNFVICKSWMGDLDNENINYKIL